MAKFDSHLDDGTPVVVTYQVNPPERDAGILHAWVEVTDIHLENGQPYKFSTTNAEDDRFQSEAEADAHQRQFDYDGD